MRTDPRALRFGAALTTVILALVLVTGSAWLLAAQAVVFALGTIGRSPYATALQGARQERPEGDRGRSPAALRTGGRARLRGRGAGRIRRGDHATGHGGHGCGSPRRLPQRSLRILPWLRDVPADSPSTARRQNGGFPMSRSDVLVDADWVEANLDTPGVVLVEVDEDTSAYDKGHIRGAVKIDWKTGPAGPGPPRLRRQDRLRGAAVRARHRQRRHRRPLRRQQQLVRRLRLLVLQALRPREASSCSTAAARSGSSTPASWSRTCRSADQDPVRRPGAEDTGIRAFRDDVVAAIGKLNLVDVRSPDEFTGKLLAPAHLPQEQAQRGGHVPTARNIPWSKAANDDGTFKSDDELRELYAGGGRRLRQGHDRLLPHRRAFRAHLVRAARAARPGEREELRRFVDRVRLARGRADRAGRGPLMTAQGCGAPEQTIALPTGIDLSNQAVIQGRGDRCRHRLRAAAGPHR